jgi:hypothetical protein
MTVASIDRALALFDPLFRRAALVVEADDALGRPCQVGDVVNGRSNSPLPDDK